MSDLSELLSTLASSANQPQRPLSLSPSLYTRDDVFELEMDRIFAREWLCVGRADELPESGDYRVLELLGEPLILVRDRSGKPRIFSNICRHRLSKLLSGTGKVKRIVCPYHAWTYDLEGRLLAARYMGDEFSAGGICLPELKTEIWQGFLFTSFDDSALPLTPRLQPLSAHLHNYRTADFEPGFQVEEIWHCNWKSLVENFTDAYHLFRVHRTTVEHALPTRLCQMLEGGEQFSLFDQYRNSEKRFDDTGEHVANNSRLTAEERQKVPLFAVFPSLLVSVSPERLFWVIALPLTTDSVAVRWGVDLYPGLVPPGSRRESMLSELRNFFDRLNGEDKSILNWLQSNAQSRFAERGQLSTKEHSLRNFHCYLAGRLADSARK